MQKFFSRLFPIAETPEPITPGIYHHMFPQGVENPNRLHLRIETNGSGMLLINAATILHLNATAAEHVYFWIAGKTEGDAAEQIARRYRVSRAQALKNQKEIREQITYLAEAPDLDPIMFIGLDRTEPYSDTPPAPYRLDCALTYKVDKSGSYDPNARARVDKELSLEEWKTILEKAWDFGIPHVTFTGGEPCLWDKLPELIAHGEQLGQITGLLTNGKRLVEKTFLSALDQSGLDHILITYEPGNEESEKGLEAALDTDIFTAVHISADDDSVLQVLDTLQAKGVTAVSLSTGKADSGPIQDARDHAASLGLDLIWDLPVPYSTHNPISLELESQLSGDGRAWLYVEPDADILPAQGVDVILGNLMRDPWQVIWDNARSWRANESG